MLRQALPPPNGASSTVKPPFFKIPSDLFPLEGYFGGPRADLWDRLLRHWRDLCGRLDRDPGLRVAFLDLPAGRRLAGELRNTKFRERSFFDRWRETIPIDEATGLHREWYLRRRLSQEIDRGDRFQEETAILVLEPERGDGPVTREEVESLLGGIGEWVPSILRKSDLASRLGRSGMALLLPGTGRKGANLLLDRLRLIPSRPEIRPRSGAGIWNQLFRVAVAVNGRDGATAGNLLRKATRDLESGSGPEGRSARIRLHGRLHANRFRKVGTSSMFPPALTPFPGAGMVPGGRQGFLDRSSAPSYSQLLSKLVGIHFDEAEARRHWAGLDRHRRSLEVQLDRPVGFQVAVLDYFLNLHRYLGRPVLVTEEAFSRLVDQSIEDPLTGLASASHMVSSIRAEVRRSRRRGGSFSLLCLDLERKGDPIDREVAGLIQGSIRGFDIAGRLDGGRFLLLLPGTAGLGPLRVAERIRAGVEGRLAIRVGIAEYPRDGIRPETLLEQARRGVNRSRSAGRNRLAGSPIPSGKERYGHPGR